MANPYFQFKQFTIYQNECAMKVGTDGVLLGAWANCSRAKNILDIGTGTGLIALMMAQRSPETTHIDAVELHDASAKQAQQNVLASKWPHKVRVFNHSFQYFTTVTTKRYDLIVSNPPYFNNDTKAATKLRTQAKHTDSLSPIELLEGVQQLLTEKGIFALVLPYTEALLFKELALSLGFFCQQELPVKSMVYKPIKRLLMTFTLYQTDTTVQATLVIGDGRTIGYTADYKKLTQNFYLAF